MEDGRCSHTLGKLQHLENGTTYMLSTKVVAKKCKKYKNLQIKSPYLVFCVGGWQGRTQQQLDKRGCSVLFLALETVEHEGSQNNSSGEDGGVVVVCHECVGRGHREMADEANESKHQHHFRGIHQPPLDRSLLFVNHDG